eukprot:6843-Heterococcus_DN1.PRE.1
MSFVIAAREGCGGKQPVSVGVSTLENTDIFTRFPLRKSERFLRLCITHHSHTSLSSTSPALPSHCKPLQLSVALLSQLVGFNFHQQAKQLNMFKTVITLLALFMISVGVLGADTRGDYSCWLLLSEAALRMLTTCMSA